MMLLRGARLVACASALSACSPGGALGPRNAGAVVVQVSETSGAGVANVTVRLQLRSGLGGGSFTLDGRTNAAGSYTYGAVEEGLLPMTVVPPAGYTSGEPLFRTLTVTRGDTARTTFVLTKTP